VTELSRLPIFAGCNLAERGLIDFLMCETRIPPGRVLVREGLPANQMLVVVSGTARISRGGETLGIAETGTCVAGRELRVGAANSLTMNSVTEMVVLVASAAESRALMEALPNVNFVGPSGELVFDERLLRSLRSQEPECRGRPRRRHSVRARHQRTSQLHY